METLSEKIKRKKAVLKYLNELIDEYQEELNDFRAGKKEEFKGGVIKTLVLAILLVISFSLTFATLGTSISLPVLIICTPIMSVSLLGLPISISMLISYQKQIGKRVVELEKLINMAALREEYEIEVLRDLEEALKQNNYPKSKDTDLTYIDEKLVLNDELKTCAFNMRKLIKAKKAGKLENYLWERYNVGDKEDIEMYENMINLYLNNPSPTTTLVPKSRNLTIK